MTNFDWPLLRARLKEGILVLPHFFKNPVQGMRLLPDWDWPTMLVLQGAFAAACAVIGNLLERDILGVFVSLVLAPLASLVVIAVGSGFFYYTFLFIFKREIPFRQIWLHQIFAAIPVLLTAVAATIIPPVILIGVAAAMYLLFIGFTENFHLERIKVKKLVIGLGAIYALFWATQFVSYSNKHDHLRLKATPESLDILEKELKFED